MPNRQKPRFIPRNHVCRRHIYLDVIDTNNCPCSRQEQGQLSYTWEGNSHYLFLISKSMYWAGLLNQLKNLRIGINDKTNKSRINDKNTGI